MSARVLGILGGGQLGRMLALAGARLGVRTRVFDPAPDACAGDVAELVAGDYADESALARFCDGLEAATIEFENVPVAAARFVAARVPLRPSVESFEFAQDRLVERELLERVGFRTPAYRAVDEVSDLSGACAQVGLSAILKSRRFGYDGKGQAWIRDVAQAEDAWQRTGARPAILDEVVSFSREISLVVVRAPDGTTRHYPPIENVHRNGILHTSRAPAMVDDRTLSQMQSAVERLVEVIGHVGVLTVEFFEDERGYLANEYAPRVHNSGHWTIEGAMTSQFENHVRAVMGMPLGSTEALGYSGMVNLVGSAEFSESLLEIPGAQIHLYGKASRPGRKVGHVSLQSPSASVRDLGLEKIAELVRGGGRHVNTNG
jgi:5-(carboxyamino)imidazole ribonucleotide synthase